MIIIKASVMGICFGVREAIKTAMELPNPETTTIHGHLVHNEQVLGSLLERGFEIKNERDRASVSNRASVLITAHGVSERERERLRAAGKRLIDTTCPLVKRIHNIAQMLEREGYFIIVIGKQGHVEVEGLTGDLKEFTVVEAIEEVESYGAARLGVICQSTTSPLTAEAVIAEIYKRNPECDIRYVPTMCQPTLDRQKAALELMRTVDALVVVGGRDSNNTRQLARLAQLHDVPSFFVQMAAELKPEWFTAFECVGLTAGTSTPDETIAEVYDRLMEIAVVLRDLKEKVS